MSDKNQPVVLVADEIGHVIAALKAGDYERAAVEALDSKWARQVGARADRIAALYREA